MDDLNLNKEESEYLELILQALEGVISVENAGRLKAWRLLSAANNTFYLDIINLQESMDLLRVYKTLNPEKSLKDLHKKIDADPLIKIKERSKIQNIHLKRWIGVAASVLIASVVAFYFIKQNDIVSLQTTATSVKNFVLPDSTTIYLNANSEINYSKSGFMKKRKLNLLKGEAFLIVAHDPARPFSIQHKSLIITDIGTSFNVKTSQNQTTVSVNSGQVKLTAGNTVAETILNAGEAAYYAASDNSIRKEEIRDPNYKAYTDHRIYFSSTPLPQVIRTLRSIYHKRIEIESEDIKTRKFTGEFKGQKLKDILSVLSESLKIDIITKNKVILLRSKN